jgi:ketosteroid isomerase-like protein
MSTTLDTVTEENVYEKSQQWLEETNRHDLLEYLYETCNPDFIKNHLVQEMVTWMGEDDFREFFKHIARHWEIKTAPELELLMNS